MPEKFINCTETTLTWGLIMARNGDYITVTEVRFRTGKRRRDSNAVGTIRGIERRVGKDAVLEKALDKVTLIMDRDTAERHVNAIIKAGRPDGSLGVNFTQRKVKKKEDSLTRAQRERGESEAELDGVQTELEELSDQHEELSQRHAALTTEYEVTRQLFGLSEERVKALSDEGRELRQQMGTMVPASSVRPLLDRERQLDQILAALGGDLPDLRGEHSTVAAHLEYLEKKLREEGLTEEQEARLDAATKMIEGYGAAPQNVDGRQLPHLSKLRRVLEESKETERLRREIAQLRGKAQKGPEVVAKVYEVSIDQRILDTLGGTPEELLGEYETVAKHIEALKAAIPDDAHTWTEEQLRKCEDLAKLLEEHKVRMEDVDGVQFPHLNRLREYLGKAEKHDALESRVVNEQAYRNRAQMDEIRTKEELGRLQKRYDKLESKAQDLREELKSKERGVGELREEFSRRTREKDVELTGTKDELETAQQDYEELQREFTALERKYQRQLTTIERELNGVKDELIAVENERRRLEGEHDLATDEVGKLQDKLQEAAEEMRQAASIYQAQIATLTTTIIKQTNRNLVPDSEAEFLDAYIGYLLGIDDEEKLTASLEQLSSVRKLPGRGNIHVRNYASLAERLDQVLEELTPQYDEGECSKFKNVDREKIKAKGRAIIEAYFSGAVDEEWSPELWGDDKQVSVQQMALAYRKTTRNIIRAINKDAGKAEHHSITVSKEMIRFYRWGDVKRALQEESKYDLRSPERKSLDEEVKKASAQLEEIQSQLDALTNRTTAEQLIDVFREIYTSQFDEAVQAYNQAFPEGTPENIGPALQSLENYVFEQVELRQTDKERNTGQGIFAEVDDRLGEEEVTIEYIKEILQSKQIEFSETEYAATHLEKYELASAGMERFMHKRSRDLTATEEKAKAVIDEWEQQRVEHYRIKQEATKLLNQVQELKGEWEQSHTNTTAIRESLPIEATFGCYAFSFHEGGQYKIRFLIPSTEETLAEEATIEFIRALSSSFRSRVRDSRVTTNAGEIRGCHFIDLVYSSDVSERVPKIIEKTNKDLQGSDLRKMGAELELHYFGQIGGEHDRT